MKIANLPDDPARDDIETHIVESCRMCGGDPQVLADLDDATDDELLAYITDTHAWYERNPAR
jgi:hypothetical protein